jgi:hypothetical protein
MADDDNTMNDNNDLADDTTIQPLAEDNDTPFSPSTDGIDDPAADLDVRIASGQLDPTHQVTDSADNLDPTQIYNEGLAGAAEASEPNAGNAVVGYDPDKDQRKKEQ